MTWVGKFVLPELGMSGLLEVVLVLLANELEDIRMTTQNQLVLMVVGRD